MEIQQSRTKPSQWSLVTLPIPQVEGGYGGDDFPSNWDPEAELLQSLGGAGILGGVLDPPASSPSPPPLLSTTASSTPQLAPTLAPVTASDVVTVAGGDNATSSGQLPG